MNQLIADIEALDPSKLAQCGNWCNNSGQP